MLKLLFECPKKKKLIAFCFDWETNPDGKGLIKQKICKHWKKGKGCCYKKRKES